SDEYRIAPVVDLHLATLSLRDALPISRLVGDDEEVADEIEGVRPHLLVRQVRLRDQDGLLRIRDVERGDVPNPKMPVLITQTDLDRKSTRLNSSHVAIS